MIYGYVRVSTGNQARYGNSIEDQRELLEANGAQEVYTDVYTGTKDKRPELEKLLKVVTEGDTIVVTKLDRIARSTVGGIEIIDRIMEKGASLNVLNMGVFSDTPTGRLTRTIFLAFAEFERDMIVERTQAGKEIARQRKGFKDGRPAKESKVLFPEIFKRVKKGEITVEEACGELGISKSCYYEWKKQVA